MATVTLVMASPIKTARGFVIKFGKVSVTTKKIINPTTTKVKTLSFKKATSQWAALRDNSYLLPPRLATSNWLNLSRRESHPLYITAYAPAARTVPMF